MENNTQPAACPLCGSDGFKTLGHWGFTMVACTHCGLVYMRPVDWDGLRDLYANRYAYGRLGSQRFPPPSPWDRERQRWIESQFDFGGGRKKTVLEIGCGAGRLLSLFSSDRWDTTGIEPDKDSCAYAVKTRGLNVKNCFLEEADIPAASMDAVVMISTLEHIQHPRPELIRIAKVIKPGGRLLIEIPNLDHVHGLFIDWTWRGFRPTCEHLFCYSHTTIRAMLESCGFRVESISDIRENMLVAAVPDEKAQASALPDPGITADDPERVIGIVRAFKRKNLMKAPFDTLRLMLETALIALLPKGLVTRLRELRKNSRKKAA